MNEIADILSIGMTTPVGLTAGASAAAARAGISRVKLSSIQDSRLQPLRAAFLEDEYLPPLTKGLRFDERPLTSRYRRMLRLATRALQEACPDGDAPPLFLALPETPNPEGPIGASFLEHLSVQSGVKFDLSQSRVFPLGRAGGLVAMESACQALREGRFRTVLVGGVDTYLDLGLLGALEMEGRLLVEGALEGFIPGEGAAFLCLGTSREARRRKCAPLARLLALGQDKEPGHLYSQEPYRGEGLARALGRLFAASQAHRPRVRSVYASFNGENFWAKEWGVAHLRHSQHFEDHLHLEHPIECMGDLGAALGPMMSGLAALGLDKGYRAGPILVWASSDRESRAAVLLGEARGG
ncbi:beta-ketoacyl synthase N-terminal-like domain-containing protein [Myxococcus qinghaiensis]|uniref:beta-ketoacyl synthase N-terminal-like domain-containing protein n=1 Tax=Myxococcus qinghaiensis TaxID=2906758 RepID=UPI0020A7EF9A|nr:beta-ketoacyl synthase N-terminal-like domain-containing protein [Myxococcus qinghaiensis]MCP3168086.1 hypothetical protein [Myxococcus qinghaiensis]